MIPSDPELWLVELAPAAPALARLDGRLGLLPPEDRTRFEQSTNAAVREERLAAHRALRVVIERVAGPEKRARPFVQGAQGKPALPGLDLQFSLSHAGGLALIGVARGCAIGVDIEQPRNAEIPERRKALIEAAATRLAGRELPAGPAQERFIAAWTRLEAYAKADGCGMARVLGRIGAVGAGPVATDPLPGPETVMLDDVAMPPGHLGAVCRLGHGAKQSPATAPLRPLLLPATDADLSSLLAGTLTAKQL